MKASSYRSISIYCAGCRTLLYKYRKRGRGGLVKCLEDRILEDHTAADMHCPRCGQEFARLKMYAGRRGHKIIQGKVYVKGMPRK